MEEEKKAEMKEEAKTPKISATEKFRENPWILSTIVAGALILILLIANFGGITGHAVSSNNIGEYLVTFMESAGYTGFTIKDVTSEKGFYLVNLDYQGKTYPFYVTKSGYFIGNELTSIIPQKTSSSSDKGTTAEIPKTDKPSVELYVFTYCPYGTQAEKGILPVVKLFGDKIDFKIRQIGAMHGEFEKIEAERQLCIEKNYPTKYLDYVSAFIQNENIGNCKGDVSCLTPLLNSIYSKLGIDASKINSCMTTEGVTMYNDEVSNAQSKGISGSPTLVINGVEIPISSDYKYYVFNDQKIPFSRSPSTYKDIICSLFSDVPTECSQVLSTASPSAGFGVTSGSSSSAQCS